LENFKIGEEVMPAEIIEAFALLKKACATANMRFRKLSQSKADSIAIACDKILAGEAAGEVPLRVWQTGSGTQTNMNVNEVIAHLSAEEGYPLHPNDEVNLSQSSNDTFPTAMSIAAVSAVKKNLLPALAEMEQELKAYRLKELPATQIAKELSTQHPHITALSLASGNRVEGTTQTPVVIAIITSPQEITKEDSAKIGQWLSVRLDAPNVKVFVEKAQ
jgi:fumarate hydratase class II